MIILIIANARYKGGLSGSDAIFENFKKFWPCDVIIKGMQGLDYRPFALCYAHRILLGCCRALFDFTHYDFVYSASDFLPDVLPALIYKLKGKKWIAGYFLHAFKDNPTHYYSQMVVRRLINVFADMVIVTNETMYKIFPDKKKTWINGGIDLSLAGVSNEPKIYDAVFCGRIHASKGIDELLEIWKLVIENKPNARLAIIGDGDLGMNYIRYHKNYSKGIDLLGYRGDDRFKIYKQSKVVLYTTPLRYDHFSMAPVEAMACGCSLFTFNTPVIRKICPPAIMNANSNKDFATNIIYFLNSGYSFPEISIAWAQQYEYEQQALRVWRDLNANLNNGESRDGRNSFGKKSGTPSLGLT